MDNAAAVGSRESVGDGGADLSDLLPRQAGRRNALAEGIALEEFGNRVVDTVRGSHIVDLEEIGVSQRGQGLGFAVESFEAGFILGERLGQDFDSHLAVELGILRPPHLTHPTGPNGTENFVSTETITLR